MTNNDEKDQKLVIGIVSLDQTDFKIRFIESSMKGLNVKLDEKFSYMFDD